MNRNWIRAVRRQAETGARSPHLARGTLSNPVEGELFVLKVEVVTFGVSFS